ncbi:Oidioi.mRNA.OKI2018_I69.chr2.g4942.t1.cds [Oikopleura dioica]|uniref:Oidioi.mRNA.OKI2018_I69.chr2.g4942.t1.cds n=1 Tax=Oikopleura dioica TaxID=34765 RepID=A0ABN7T372_OIKDI|nr:Oidioi.mRNA.OKI2018_I69.chr2.g4942.t1.cds [Oikopleura dioica]
MKTLLFAILLFEQILAGSEKWKRVPNTEIEVMDFDGLYGKRKACGINPVKKTPPLFAGEMRQVHCHIYFCRQSDFEDKLEKWKCTSCAENTPECKDYQLRRQRRNLSNSSQADDPRDRRHIARRSRKLEYRRMKRLALKKKRTEERDAIKRKRAEERAARRRQKKILRSGKKKSATQEA